MYSPKVTFSARRILSRLRGVELAILIESLALAFVGSIVLAAIIPLHPAAFRIALSLLVGVVVWSIYARWRQRKKNWRRFTQWAKMPLRVEGALLTQENEKGRRLGTIDTRDHYTVRWECFTSDRALYSVSQRTQIVFVSTLAPKAVAILKDVLHVANYPCEDWPNLDI